MAITTFEQLLQARELVKQRQYVQARTLLETIDHPTAKQWLKKLDSFETDKPSSSAEKYHPSNVVIFFVVSFIIIIANAILMRMAAP